MKRLEGEVLAAYGWSNLAPALVALAQVRRDEASGHAN